MALFLCATMYQGDERFNVQTRGKQCAFMSLAAVITTHNNPLIDWSTTMFDNVLSQGDQMYLKVLNKGLIVLEQGVEFLSIDNLPKVVSVSGCSSMFSYDIIDTVNLQPVTVRLPVVVAQNNNDLPIEAQNNNDQPIVVEPVEAQNKIDLPIVVEPVEAQNKIDLPIVVEPVETQNKIDLPIVVEPVEAQNKIDLPIVVEPVETQNKIDLPIVVEPVEAQNKINLPIVVEPVEAQNKIDLPIVVEPSEARNNDNLPVPIEPNEEKNENQILYIKYGDECQGLVIMEGDIGSHYYNIHTALLNAFYNDRYAILVLEGY